MYWFLGITFLISLFSNLSEAKHEKKLPSAVVIGTVYCDTCFKTDFSKTSHFISGALVAVECGDTNAKPSFREEVKTNKRGEFKVYLPFLVSKHVKKIKGCSVKLISSSEPYCAVASTATSYSLHLKSRKQGIHIFSAGFFTFKPLKQPTLCSQKPSLLISKGFSSKKTSNPVSVTTVPPPTQNPTPMPYLPPPDKPLFPPLPVLPTLPPLPQLPPLPPLPGFPNFPKPPKMSKELESTHPLKTSELSNGKAGQTKFSGTLFEMPLFASPQPGFGFQLPPNPFQPPLFFPPNPVQPPPLTLPPTPPTSIFPRNPLQPSPPVSRVPPLIGLTPSPPPPPPPANVPVALPPFPFQPSLGFPGIPPIRKKTSP